MRVNTARSIATANAVYERYGSWKAARDSAHFVNGKYMLPRSDDADAIRLADADGVGIKPRTR